MLDTLFSTISPHYCCSCGEIGTILCSHCNYYIFSEGFQTCVVCNTSIVSDGVCDHCKVPYSRAWCVGKRAGALQQLIGDFKFNNVYAAHRPLADLLHETISQLPPETVVVPVPTVRSHVRQRGYDHTRLIGRRLAKLRGLKYAEPLRRATSTKQRDAGKKQRQAQAKAAFETAGNLDPAIPYLLVDDVMTTGATVYYAAEALRRAGAAEVWVAVVARQTLD